MYINDGLVGKLVSKSGVNKTTSAAAMIPNRASRLTRVVPIPPEYFRPRQPRPMIFPMNQDNPTGSYKTFIITNLHDDHRRQLPQQLFLHDSQTNEWRGILQNQPYVVKSAATVENTLFITSHHVAVHNKWLQQCVKISSYNHEEDSWEQRALMTFGRRTPGNSQLVVAGLQRLFLVVHLGGLPTHNHVDLELPQVKPASPFVTGRPKYHIGSLHEMYEIHYDSTSTNARVVQFDCCQIRHMFGEEVDEPEIFPCLDDAKFSRYSRVQSCLLVSPNSGQVRKCTFATGSVDVLPQHPLLPGLRRDGRVTIFHGANNMMFGLRNLELELSTVCASNPFIRP
jgi:hypothetical protein